MPPISTSLGKYRLSSTRMAGLLPRSGWTGEVEADPLGITAFRAATRLFACGGVDLGRPRLVRARSAHVSFGASEFGWYRSLLKCSPESGPGAFTDLSFSHQDGVFTPIRRSSHQVAGTIRADDNLPNGVSPEEDHMEYAGYEQLAFERRPNGILLITLNRPDKYNACLLYTSDAADEEDSVDLGGR